MNTKTIKQMPTTLESWIMVIRPRTLPIPTIQVLVGAGLAYQVQGTINITLALFTWFVALFITIGTNLINDVIDFEKGGDPLKRVGHTKVIRAGLLTKQQVYAGGMVAFALAIICAIPLVLAAGWLFLPLVILSAICGYCYTGGHYPISYLGLSEIFIFVFYGGVCVLSSFFVQTLFVNGASLLLAAQFGMLAILPNALNNFRDVFEDAQVNKRTLAVRFGRHFARLEIALMTMLPFVLNLGWFFLGYPEAGLFPFLLIPLAFLFVGSVWKTEPSPIFNRFFLLSILIHFCFGLLLVIGLLLN